MVRWRIQTATHVSSTRNAKVLPEMLAGPILARSAFRAALVRLFSSNAFLRVLD
jgi:hypothetical protein